MAEKTRCEICDRTFKDAGGLSQHNLAVHSQQEVRRANSINVKKIRNWVIFIVVLIAIGILIYLPLRNIENLPPIDIEGHVESNPPSHILKEQMPIAIQKHMLEHVDGIEGGRGGVIINYNCKDYECEAGLIEKLEAFAQDYDYVYVTPFKGMDAKIALTKLNKREVLEEYNNETIEKFIK